MTKVLLATGTSVVVSATNFKTLLGDATTVPAGAVFTPADPSIVTAVGVIGGARFIAGAVGETTVTYKGGQVSETIDVEVIDAAAAVSAEFAVGEVTPVTAA